MPKKRNWVVKLAPSWETWTKPVKTAVVEVEISCKTIKKWRKMRKSTDHVISLINRRVDSHVIQSLFFPSFFFFVSWFFFFSLSKRFFFPRRFWRKAESITLPIPSAHTRYREASTTAQFFPAGSAFHHD